ncbi:MAG: hypothetical protein ACXW2Y_08860 [Acidimicrobiia bacterium]
MPMRGVTRGVTVWERIYFGVIALAALFVAYLGFFEPAEMDADFTWAFLPPLHARFVASLYLFGGVYMAGCLFARYRAQVQPGPIAVVIFTSLLLLITLLNPKAFDYDLAPPWVWTMSYVIYPILGIILAWFTRGPASTPGVALPRWAQTFLVVQAVVFAIAGVALLTAPGMMVDLWPWPITKGLAQFYGGPFVAYAYCSWAYSRRETWTEVKTIVPAMFAFTFATVVVSLVHRELFSASDLSTWVWFAVFGGATVVLMAMGASMIMADRSTPHAPSGP